MKSTDSQTEHLNNTPSGSCFWGHKWSQWEQYEQPFKTKHIAEVYEVRQKKHCLRCNKVQDELIS